MEVSNSKIAGKIQMVDGELMTERDQELVARRCLIGQMNKGWKIEISSVIIWTGFVSFIKCPVISD